MNYARAVRAFGMRRCGLVPINFSPPIPVRATSRIINGLSNNIGTYGQKGLGVESVQMRRDLFRWYGFHSLCYVEYDYLSIPEL